MLEAYREALALRQAAADVGALFIVNDRCDLAAAVEADGVHLGQDDLPIAHARAILGRGKLIGISTHSLEQVRAASEAEASYIGFGPVFATGTKPDHEPVVGLDGLMRAVKLATVPLFAIGGITVHRIDDVRRTGAAGVAVISAIAQAEDVAHAAASFVAGFP